MSDGHNHGNKPNMDRSVLTILVQLTAVIHPPPSQLYSSDLPAELLPMLTVAATCLGYTANGPDEKEGRKTGKDRERQVYLSAEDPVFKTACKTDNDTWILVHDDIT